jgi:hypothetical protein
MLWSKDKRAGLMAQGLSLKEVGQVSHLIPFIYQESDDLYILFYFLGSISKSEVCHKCSGLPHNFGACEYDDIKTKLL